jgi:hypothetical protein
MTPEGTKCRRPRWWTPSLLPYVIALHLARVGFAATAAYPFAAITSRTLGSWPGGDAQVFEPGGHLMLEVVRLHRAALWSSAEQAALLLLLALPIGAVLEGLLLSAVTYPGSAAFRRVAGRTASAAGALGVLEVARLIVIAGVTVTTWLLWQGLIPKLSELVGIKAADISAGMMAAMGVLLVLAVEVMYDVSRAAAVVEGLDALRALVRGCTLMGTRLSACAFGYGARAAGALFVVVSGWQFTAVVGVATDARAAVTATVQQAVLIALLMLRGSWLVRACELLGDGQGHRTELRPVLPSRPETTDT